MCVYFFYIYGDYHLITITQALMNQSLTFRPTPAATTRRMKPKKGIQSEKMLITLFFMLIATYSPAQKVFSTAYENQAEVKVFVVKYESQADLKVFKVKYESQAGDNSGKWFFTKYESQASKKIFFVDYESQADLKIFFVPYESQAGWRDKSKKALLY